MSAGGLYYTWSSMDMLVCSGKEALITGLHLNILIHTRIVSLMNCYITFRPFSGYYFLRGLGLDFDGMMVDLLFIYLFSIKDAL